MQLNDLNAIKIYSYTYTCRIHGWENCYSPSHGGGDPNINATTGLFKAKPNPVSLGFICAMHFCGIYVLSSVTKTQSLTCAPEGSAKKTMASLMGDTAADDKIRRIGRHGRSDGQKA